MKPELSSCLLIPITRGSLCKIFGLPDALAVTNQGTRSLDLIFSSSTNSCRKRRHSNYVSSATSEAS